MADPLDEATEQRKLPVCVACAAAHHKEHGEDDYIEPKTLSPEEVTQLRPEARRYTRENAVSHHLDLERHVGSYFLPPRSEQCSYSEGNTGRGHEHGNGFMIYTDCDEFLQLGGTCCKNFVGNLEDFERLKKQGRKVAGTLQMLQEAPRRAAELVGLAAEGRRRIELREQLEALFPVLHTVLDRSANRPGRRSYGIVRLDGRKGYRVTVPVLRTREQQEEGLEPITYEDVPLLGLELFAELSPSLLHSWEAAAATYARDCAASLAAESYKKNAEITRLGRVSKEFREAVTDAQTLLQVADRFWSHQNLRRACFGAKDDAPDELGAEASAFKDFEEYINAVLTFRDAILPGRADRTP
jgi:hypothetical protein